MASPAFSPMMINLVAQLLYLALTIIKLAIEYVECVNKKATLWYKRIQYVP